MILRVYAGKNKYYQYILNFWFDITAMFQQITISLHIGFDRLTYLAPGISYRGSSSVQQCNADQALCF